MPFIFIAVYACAVIGVTILVLLFIARFVRAHERIAGALERMAQAPRRDVR